MSICQNSTRSDFVSAGSTVSSWCFMKTYVSTLSGRHRWLNTELSRCSTRSQQRSGRFWEPLPSAFSTSTKPSKPTELASLSDSAPRLSLVFYESSRRLRAHARPWHLSSDWSPGNIDGTASLALNCCTRYVPLSRTKELSRSGALSRQQVCPRMCLT